ncbi:uncharacterized protein F5147DRAFT_775847 [Suillus discolor]|uniref:Uncharacterized protein n=1 Tax=Suillus discolor TaxID=1912936 RepID=A0A9P7JRZ5_9AGAM|nr:uncharacterized protein F5147DRAFT_775847 [Suillus discolor]KAG2103723.1 hypothetical protein F5147DRAFT_775847 [Suillus discolor]
MDKADATTILGFWFTWQENNFQPAFSFKAWKDSDGEMEEAVLCPPTTRHGKASKQAKGKGKGKANRKHNHCAAMDSDAEGESDSDVASSSDDEEASSADKGQEALLPRQVAMPPTKSGKVKSQPTRSRRDAKQVMGKIVEEVNAPTTSGHPGGGT